MDDNFDLNALMRPPRMCVCQGVPEEEIREVVLKGGKKSFEEVQAATGCSTGCGTCEERIRNYIDHLLTGAERGEGS